MRLINNQPLCRLFLLSLSGVCKSPCCYYLTAVQQQQQQQLITLHPRHMYDTACKVYMCVGYYNLMSMGHVS